MIKSEELLNWFNSVPVDAAETMKLELAIAIDAAIRSKNMTRKQVADAVQTSPAWITKVLRGDVNLTIESMVKLCQAIDHKVEIKIVRQKSLSEENIVIKPDKLNKTSPGRLRR